MNNSKKSHKTNDLSSQPSTKLKIITNSNGMTAIPVNGKARGRPPKHNSTVTNALDVFTFVSLFDFVFVSVSRDSSAITGFFFPASKWGEVEQG